MSTVALKRNAHRYLLFVLGSVLAMFLGFFLDRVFDDGRTPSLRGAAQTPGGGASDTPSGGGIGDGGAEVTVSSLPFTIHGNAATPISPGLMSPLNLMFANPNAVSLSVTGLYVTVRKVSAPNADDAHPCSVRDFTVGQASSNLRITLAAQATRTLSSLDLPLAQWPQVGMLQRSVNQDGCKGASLTLAYAASGILDK